MSALKQPAMSDARDLAIHVVKFVDGRRLRGTMELVFNREEENSESVICWHAFVSDPTQPHSRQCICGDLVEEIRWEGYVRFVSDGLGGLKEFSEFDVAMEAIQATDKSANKTSRFGWLDDPKVILQPKRE